MIPLHKLLTLNRSQRLRKAAKTFADAERRLIVSGHLAASDTEYLLKIIELLIGDEGFSLAEITALKTAKFNLESTEKELSVIRRALNTVYQILLTQTGRYQSDWDFIESSGTLDPAKRKPFPGMVVYLEDIRSPFNVGSMFRAAEAFGAEKIWISPLCADPRHKRALRTAMGTVDLLPWERFSEDPFDSAAGIDSALGGEALFREFLSGPFFTLETGGTPLPDFSFPPRGIIIAGSEELGVSPGALKAADSSLGRVTIPSYGAKGSLNVSVAFGIVMQAWSAKLAMQ